jgi:uncharacterized protein (TIGR02302 family)
MVQGGPRDRRWRQADGRTPMAYSSDPLKSRRYRAKYALARVVLLWEAFWSVAAPAVGVIVGGIAIGLLEIPQSLAAWFGGPVGGVIHTCLLAFLLGILLWFTRRAISRFPVPRDTDIKHRIEASSGLSHRPLTALSDTLANATDQRMTRLWEAFRRRALHAQSRLRVGAPKPILPRLDPFAIRAGLGLLLVIALTIGWRDPSARLWAAMTPSFNEIGGSRVASIDVWISPPAYTGHPPMLLTGSTGPGAVITAKDQARIDSSSGSPADAASDRAVVPVPIGSKVLAAVTGGTSVPELIIGSSSTAPTPFEAVGTDSYRLETTLSTGASLAVRQDGEILSQWTLNVIPDLPPRIAFSEAPSPTNRASLMIEYKASDDHGLAEASAVIQRLSGADTPTEEEPIVIPMPLPGLGQKEVSGKSFKNLTSHAWAGLHVRMVLQARDEIGQIGRSESVDMILPERIFTHPVARAVIEQRKRLANAPDDRRDVAKVIMTIAARPHRYNHDLVAFLSLKSAASRLGLNRDGSEDGSVSTMLWDTALRIEDGNLSVAARRLRELQRELQEALAGDASDEKIEQLMDQLKEAIDEYLQAMTKQMENQQGQQQQGQGQEEMSDAMQRQDLQEMIERMRDMAKTGARDSAQEMLSKLQEMMENMRMGQKQMSPQQRAMQEMMRQLSDLSRQQQQLMDDTYKQHQNGSQQSRDGQNESDQWGRMGGRRMQQPPRFGDGWPRERNQGSQRSGQRRDGQPGGPKRDGQGMSQDQLARAQEQLRRELGEFMRKLSEGINQIPDGFGQAERAMKDAVGALNKGEPGDAVGPQADALGRMQEGARALNEFLREQTANGQGTPNDQAQGTQDGRQDEIDPLNRRRSGQGFFDRSTLGIPDESDVQKARRLFDELRRRSGERSRPELELEYIDRLLKRF